MVQEDGYCSYKLANYECTMLLKHGIMDKDQIRGKLDVIKQKPKQQVQAYYDKTNKLFTRSKLQYAKQILKIIFELHPKIKKFCVMRDHANMDVILVGNLKVDQILIELGKTPFELLKEEQEDRVVVDVVGEK
jgi:hypothetical protein